jgi:type IV pilus assembly protein PilY1
VFFGGGFRIYDTSLTFESPYPSITASTDLLNLLRRPNLMAIDIETGENLFRYTWPWVYSSYGSTLFPDMSRGPSTNPNLYKIPYAMGDISIADLIRGHGGNYYPGTDGLIDHIYVGDMTGYLWGFTFVGFERYFPSGDPRGIRVDLWTTKAVDESETSYYWSHFRSLGQPITVQPALSIDKYNERYLRIIFGAGKFDDVMGNYDDKSDPAKTSIYNLRTSIFPSSEAPDYTVSPLLSSALNFWFRIQCRNQATGSPLVPDMTKRRTNFGTGCKWMSSEGNGDCCEAQSGTSVACNDPGLANPPCWQCVYDLPLPSTAGQAGERVTNKALIAGGLVFVTSFLPPADRCTAQGEGYLYIFDYM